MLKTSYLLTDGTN